MMGCFSVSTCPNEHPNLKSCPYSKLYLNKEEEDHIIHKKLHKGMITLNRIMFSFCSLEKQTLMEDGLGVC